jgi:hypothetical protein
MGWEGVAQRASLTPRVPRVESVEFPNPLSNLPPLDATSTADGASEMYPLQVGAASRSSVIRSLSRLALYE